MTRRRFKFVSPYVSEASACSQKHPKPQLKLITEDIQDLSDVSQSVSATSLLNNCRKKKPNLLTSDFSTPEMHSLSCDPPGIPVEEFENQENSSTSLHTTPMALTNQQPIQDAIYAFPTSPISARTVTTKRCQSKRSKQMSSSRPLLKYIICTLREIKEIRLRRKILREQGLAAFKKHKSVLMSSQDAKLKLHRS